MEDNMYSTESHEVIDTIVVIGNGFDIWQGLNTHYSEFQEYYLKHRNEIMKKLRIKLHKYIDQDGEEVQVNDVEIIYGNPFSPSELKEDFFWTFETSLESIDAERLNTFFDKNKKGLRRMNRSIQNAKRILQEAFCDWIQKISIDKKEVGYRFGNNCVFINFNYTDTLMKNFNVKEGMICHIHGNANDKDSIIVGHSSHPQLPEKQLYHFGGRFRGLYFLDNLLYQTDKHVEDNIQLLCIFLANHGVMCENIKNVFVLGHSMGKPDIKYFQFLMRATTIMQDEKRKNKNNQIETEELDALHNRIQYIVNHIGYGVSIEEIDPEYIEAAREKYEEEQAHRNMEIQHEFFKMLRKAKRKSTYQAEEDGFEVPIRTEDAKWCISYFGEDSKRYIEKVMKELEYQNYKLYSNIDECLRENFEHKEDFGE